MPYSTSAKNLMLDALNGTNPVTVLTHTSLHTADPADTGASEVTGGAYARQSITFSAAAAGALDSSIQPVFSVPGGTTVTHVGFWSASSGGTFLGGADVTDETFGADGTYTLTDADLDLNG